MIAAKGNEASAYLFYGPASSTDDLSTADAKITSECGGSPEPVRVGAAGDIDVDGHADLLVHEYLSSCRYLGKFRGWSTSPVYLLAGPLSGTTSLAEAETALLRDFQPVHLGYLAELDFTGVGDASGDGYGDILVTAWDEDPDGAAYLWFYTP